MEEHPHSPADAPEALATKGLVGSIFDFSFESFVTPKLVRFLYGLALVGVAIYTVMWIFDDTVMSAIWRLVISPVVLIVGAILARVAIEIMMVAFRILELLRRFDAERRGGWPKV